MTRSNIAIIALVIGFFVLLGFVGRMDYDDAKKQEAAYCKNVQTGLWPDYESRYALDCKDGEVIEK